MIEFQDGYGNNCFIRINSDSYERTGVEIAIESGDVILFLRDDKLRHFIGKLRELQDKLNHDVIVGTQSKE